MIQEELPEALLAADSQGASFGQAKEVASGFVWPEFCRDGERAGKIAKKGNVRGIAEESCSANTRTVMENLGQLNPRLSPQRTTALDIASHLDLDRPSLSHILSSLFVSIFCIAWPV